MPPKKAAADAASGHGKYKKVTPIEHVLLRPEMYIGSKDISEEGLWVAVPTGGGRSFKLKYKQDAMVNHGLLKIIDEILLNASDNAGNKGKTKMSYIEVTMDDAGRITIANDGAGIPVEEHLEHGLMIPDMVFGHLLTSSNYDDDADSVAAGRHGYGAKLTNIMSKQFEVECICDGKRFVKSWTNNMMKPGKEKVTNSKESNKTMVSFLPDYERFGYTKGVSKEMRMVLMKRVIDLAVSVPSVAVTFNGITLPNDFSTYAAAYAAKDAEFPAPYVQESRDGRLKFAVVPTLDTGRRPFTTINGICTYSGGTHLRFYEAEVNEAIRVAVGRYEKEFDGVKVHVKDLTRALSVVAMVVEPQPKFDSQSKVRLVSKHQFRKPTAEPMVKWLLSLPMKQFSTSALAALQKQLSKEAGKPKRRLVSDVPKLVEAPGVPGKERVLIVTEGDSAKALALSSLDANQKRQYSVFPLRGKVLNVRHDISRLKTCKELKDLFLCMGLKVGQKVTDVKSLRHQRILIMCDQDADGNHIKGLLVNALHFLWPELCAEPNFMTVFRTPLLKIFPSSGGDPIPFYTRKEYLNYIRAKPIKGTVKYYKGLGTSSTAEGKGYFSSMHEHTLRIDSTVPDKKHLDNVFAPDKIAWRKDWMRSKSLETLEPAPIKKGGVSLKDFLDSDVAEYGLVDNARMIPNAIDGLKPSQRKVLWSMLDRSDKSAQRVSQLSGFVSQKAMFHHGEASLQQTIIRMAQNFSGSNNINLLTPEGQFGTRFHTGSDSAAPRYIFSKIASGVRALFPAADDELLDRVVDDGVEVEPKFYVPVVPVLPINGCVGIGVGFSCNTPLYDPMDVINITEKLVAGDDAGATDALDSFRPWANGFRGSVERIAPDSASVHVTGAYEVFNTAKTGVLCFRVMELPWWIQIENYRNALVDMLEKQSIVDFHDFSGANHVDIDVFVKEDDIEKFIANRHGSTRASVEEYLQLTNRRSVNLVTLNTDGNIEEHFGDWKPVFMQHHKARRELYVKRRENMKLNVNRELLRTDGFISFANLFKKGKINPVKQTSAEIAAICKKHNVPAIDKSYDFLLNRTLSSFLKTNVSAMEAKRDELNRELVRLDKVTPEALWSTELQSLRKFVTKHQNDTDEAIVGELKRRSLPKGFERAPDRLQQGWGKKVPPMRALVKAGLKKP